MTGTTAEVEHRSCKFDQVPPDQGRVVLVVLPPAIHEIDVLLGRGRVGDAHGPQAHCCRLARRRWRFGFAAHAATWMILRNGPTF